MNLFFLTGIAGFNHNKLITYYIEAFNLIIILLADLIRTNQ